MKMQDEDDSVLALYYVYCAHPLRGADGDGLYTLKVYSSNNDEQYFHYKDCSKRDAYLAFISKWIEVRELGGEVSTE